MNVLLFAQMVGPKDFGSAIIAAACVAGLAIVGAYTFAYAAHAFFAVAETTAGGQDAVTWPDEPLVDRLGKAVCLAWIGCVGLGPAYLVAGAAAGDRPLATWAFALAVYGLLFPVFLMSVQVSGSPVLILHPDAVRRLMRRSDLLACYYIAVAPAYALVGFGLWLCARPAWLFAVPGAAVLAGAWLISARLYGRLALLVSRVRLRSRAAPEISPLDAIPKERSAPAPVRRRDTRGGYGVRDFDDPEPGGEPPRPSLKRVWVEEGADDPYALADGTPDAAPRRELPRSVLEPNEYEMKLAMARRPTPPPRHPWLAGTYTFPFRPDNWMALTWLTTGLTFTAVFARQVFTAAAR